MKAPGTGRGFRRGLALLVGLSVAAAVVAGLHALLAAQVLLPVAEPLGLAGPARALLIALAATWVATPLAERVAPRPVVRALAWPAGVWMGVAFLLLVSLGFVSLVLVALGAAEAAGAPDPVRLRAGLALALGAAASAVALRGGLRPPRLVQRELALDRWPRALDGYRIVQLSDIHIGPIRGRRFAGELVQRVNALDPDLVAITGDLVDGPVRRLLPEVEPLRGLRARDGVVAVLGNHDFYSGAGDWEEALGRLGVEVLRNRHRVVRRDGAAFLLAGVDDHRGDLRQEGSPEDLPAALAGAPPELPVILLAHDPSTFPAAARRGVDLQLSGHTHGGQIWPFGVLVRLAIPFVAGVHRRAGSVLYVSRGTGFWGPPMRLLAPAEITVLRLRARGAAQEGGPKRSSSR